MEWDRQVGYLAKVISLFFLNPHFEHLALLSRVDKVITYLVHASHGEVHRVLLGKEALPLLAVICIDVDWHVTLEQFERISFLVCRLIVCETPRAISNDEVI